MKPIAPFPSMTTTIVTIKFEIFTDINLTFKCKKISLLKKITSISSIYTFIALITMDVFILFTFNAFITFITMKAVFYHAFFTYITMNYIFLYFWKEQIAFLTIRINIFKFKIFQSIFFFKLNRSTAI